MPPQAAWQKGRVISSRVYFAVRSIVTTIKYRSPIDKNIHQVQISHQIIVLASDEIEVSGPPARPSRIKNLSRNIDYSS